MEYYRLCRVYSAQKRLPLSQNLYMKKAASCVSNLLGSACYSCNYVLQTKLNHARASGIVFYYDCYFSEYEELLERLIRVCHFYKSALKVLRKELKKGGQFYA